jgi:serine/threonine protein kinase/tetratricopeptide (TPR) repeat protein
MAAEMPHRDTIFCSAIEIEGEQERSAYIVRACGADAELRACVERLVEAHFRAGRFLEPSVEGPEPTGRLLAAPPGPPALPGEGPGTVVGPYKLLQVIGEGGMGTVYMAEQSHPVQRKVALKVIKPGMDSAQVVARFEQERQALALMEHPHIARVLDAGQTEGGRPYFVMELVKGAPITRYCDEHKLALKERLELFVGVCQAVQHAHQKGVIHRDLKPSNVMIALYDGKPVPKVIDFGIAKATGARLTERTLFTAFGAVVGTLEYMSPEQAELNNLDVDTRSDVYSLGVLLYELLTGTTPLERRRLEQAGLLEALRLIREEETPPPSARLSTVQELATIAANRGQEPKRLSGLVRGELDWIVMRALDKDRNRRYESASGLARDVERYLRDEPVLACPPSTTYRLRKFVRRNRRALATAGVLAVLLMVALGAVGGSTGWVMRDRQARREKLEQEVRRALGDVEQGYKRDRPPEAVAALERAEGLLATGEVGEELRDQVSRWRADLGLVVWLDRVRLDRAALVDGRYNTRGTAAAYRKALQDYGLDVEALSTDEAARRLERSVIRERLVVALDDWVLMNYLANLPGSPRILALTRRVDGDEWRNKLREAFQRRDREALKKLARQKEALAQPPATVLLLGAVLVQEGEVPLAVEALRQAQQRRPDDFWINNNLAEYLLELRPPQTEEAVALMRVAVALRPDSPVVRLNLGYALRKHGKNAEAEAAYRKALAIQPGYASAHLNLGALFCDERHDYPRALAAFREAIRLEPGLANAHRNLGVALAKQGKPAEAEAAFRQALRLRKNWAEAHNELGLALASQGRHAEAAGHFRKAAQFKKEYPEAHGNLGSALSRGGQLVEAEASFRQAIRHKHDYALAHFGLGVVLEKQGKVGEALAAYRQAANWKQDWAEALTNIAFLLEQQGQLTEAESASRRVVALRPERASDRYNLGTVLLKQGKFPEAEAVFREAIALKADWDRPHNNLGVALLKQNKLSAAAVAFRKATQVGGKWADPHINLGIVLSQQGQLDEAEVALRNALRLDRKLAEAHHVLGVVLARQGRLTEAARASRESTRLAPKWGQAHRVLGHTCARLGQWNRAVAALTAELALDPGQFWSWYHCAALCLHVGDLEGYRRACREMLRRFGAEDGPGVAEGIARSCLLRPEPGHDLQPVLKLADRAVASTTARPGARAYLLAGWLADCRAGRPAAAIKSLQRFAPKAGGGPYDAVAFAVLAIAHHQSNQPEQARTALASARATLSTRMPSPATGRPFDDDWVNWLHAQALCREAEALLKAGKE